MHRTLLLGSALLVASCGAGCALSHTRDGGGAAPVPHDAGPPPECAVSGDCASGLACRDGRCTDAPTPMPGPGMSRTYEVTSLGPVAANGRTAVGLNLDGRVSTGAGMTCLDFAPDFVSALDGAPGVDNALSTLLASITMLLGDACPADARDSECARALQDEALRRGVVRLAIVVEGIHSFREDPEVVVRVLRNGGAIAEATGTIRRGRVHASFPRPLPLDLVLLSPEPSEIVLSDVQIAAEITTAALSRGALGGGLEVEDLARRADAIMPGIGDTVRSVVGGVADLRPSPSDPARCDHLSTGLALEAVAR